MAVRASRIYRRSALRPIVIEGWPGGANFRDGAEAGPTDLTGVINYHLESDNAGLTSRLGCQNDHSSALTGAPKNLYYSSTLGKLVCQAGAKLYKRDSAGTWTEIQRAGPLDAFTTNARCAMADFIAGGTTNVLYVIHPVDGLLKYTGSGNLTLVDAAEKGSCLAVWQNRLWHGCTGVDQDVLHGSKAADGDVFATASGGVSNAIRDLGTEPIIALGPGQQLDQTGTTRATGLLVYKLHGTFRVSDASNAAYVTLSAEAGAASPISVCALSGSVFSINDKGVWVTDGSSPPVLLTEKLSPLFTSSGVSISNLQNFCAGIYRNRVIFSITLPGASLNNLMLEYDPTRDTWVTHDFASIQAMSNLITNDYSTYGAFDTGSTTTFVRQLFTGGMDGVLSDGTGGTAIYSQAQTAWIAPAGGRLCQMRHARLRGRGSSSLLVSPDYSVGALRYDLNFGSSQTAGIYGTDHFDTGALYGPLSFEAFQDIYSLGIAKRVSFMLQSTNSAASTSPKINLTGSAVSIGPTSLYSVILDYVNLGYA